MRLENIQEQNTLALLSSTTLARGLLNARDTIQQLTEERDKLRECLKWYAEESEEEARFFHFGQVKSNIGERARTILSQLEGESK